MKKTVRFSVYHLAVVDIILELVDLLLLHGHETMEHEHSQQETHEYTVTATEVDVLFISTFTF